jgi:hypothetical protein
MVATVRGTEFEMMVKPDRSGYVKLFSGELQITKDRDGSSFILKSREMVTFSAQGDFATPTRLQ